MMVVPMEWGESRLRSITVELETSEKRNETNRGVESFASQITVMTDEKKLEKEEELAYTPSRPLFYSFFFFPECNMY